jgi:processive 1,2-diacylglycerol beta-glucosyltransferase
VPELRRAMFLSGSLGKGHDAVADSYAEALTSRGVDCRTVDCMALLGAGPGAVGEWAFRTLLSFTPVYEAFHYSQLRDNGRLGQAAERAAIARMRAPLEAELLSFRPDLVVPVFATGAGAAADLKDRGHRYRTLVIMTDSFAHGMWVHEQTDLFLVTSRLAAESIRRLWPEAPVEVVTAPVRAEFLHAPDRAQARAGLGIPEEALCVLLMSGAWGLGPLDRVAQALADDDIWVIAVAGTNRRQEELLNRRATLTSRILPFGYSDRIAEFMSASDVVVTSSGDTCREARSLGRSLVLLDVVPGHGRENLLHELELGGATSCMPTPASVRRAVRSLVGDPERFRTGSGTDAGEPVTQLLSALDRLGLTLAS